MMSSVKMANITVEWLETLQSLHLALFLIPSALVTAVTLVANPVLLCCVFRSRALRRETRYLLVANTLAADVLFVVLNLTLVSCNARGLRMQRLLCAALTASTVTAYCCAILTVTLMVVDTYVAVRWPLHYHDLLPPARTHRILAGVWALAALYPFSMMIATETAKGEDLPDTTAVCLVLISMGVMQSEKNKIGVHVYFCVGAVLCTALIVYCYARLYVVTRTQGIWQSRYSRARVTVLAHGVLLLLYFAPGLVFTAELFLFQRESVSHTLRVWVCTLNMCVFMLLPRALAPFLYGLRYREISDTLLQQLLRGRRRPRGVSQVTAA